jgi:hypothetical protein
LRQSTNLTSPPVHGDQVSSDGHTALVEWNMAGTLTAAEKRIDPPQLAQAGERSIPLMLVILVLAFGSPSLRGCR